MIVLQEEDLESNFLKLLRAMLKELIDLFPYSLEKMPRISCG